MEKKTFLEILEILLKRSRKNYTNKVSSNESLKAEELLKKIDNL